MPGKNYIRIYHGKSMEGTFHSGDFLTFRPARLDEICPGDVVIYQRLNHQGVMEDVVHRIVGIASAGLIAQGDSNSFPDSSLVTGENLLGRVSQIERDGRIRPVVVGLLGLLHARLFRVRRSLSVKTMRLLYRMGKGFYQRLRQSGLIGRFWKPSIFKVRLLTENGRLVKYISGKKTVALFWPDDGRFKCRKPYDLVLKAESSSATADLLSGSKPDKFEQPPSTSL